MAATMLALTGATLTVVIYAVVTDRMDYATVQRRQLDLVVALVGFLCLSTIIYGVADVRREQRQLLAASPTAVDRPAIILRQGAVALSPDDGASAAQPVADIAPDVAPTSVGVDSGASGEPSGADAGYYFERAPRLPTRTVRPGEILAATHTPTPLAHAWPAWRAVITPVIQILPLATPSPTSLPEAMSSPVVIPIPRDPTPDPPTVVPTAEEPPPPPASPTPHCGSPDDIRASVQVVDVGIDRQTSPPTIRFRAEARNGSAFPITLRDVSVVVESGDPGSEQFGHVSPRDVAVEPGVIHVFEGIVVLTKAPSLFESTQVCVSFVTETCGRSVPYRVTKHCLAAHGF
jgi:hypothetical protein